MGTVLIKNGRLWDGEGFSSRDILTRESRVEKIGKNITETADFTFDAAGKTVTAGLVDLHVHLRGFSPDAYGISGEMSCIPFGVTAACDAGAVAGSKQLLQASAVKSLVFPSVELRNNHAHFAATERLLREYGDRAAGIKVCFDAGSGQVEDITPLKEVCAYAVEHKLKVVVHTTGTPAPMAQIVEALSPGDIITHVFHGGENTAADDGFSCLRLARSKGILLDAGFAGHIHTDFKVLQEAAAQGIFPDTISTDITRYSAYKRGGNYGMTMCMSMARLSGMPEPDIFRAVTSRPAKAVGKEGEWGTLVVGKRADISVLEYTDEGFDLTDSAGNRICSPEGYRCVLTVCDGEILYRR